MLDDSPRVAAEISRKILCDKFFLEQYESIVGYAYSHHYEQQFSPCLTKVKDSCDFEIGSTTQIFFDKLYA
jgi:hypothetical protein